jgi:hypothetical protein
MAANLISGRYGDLVDGLELLEDLLPSLGVDDNQEDLATDIRELKKLIALAGEPSEQGSLQALASLQKELLRKRAILDGF